MDTHRAGSARTRLSFFALAVVLGLGLAGCERDYGEEFVENMVSRTDKFFDVDHATGDTFVIVGYNGRIIRSEDAGETWTEIESPAEWALTQVQFIDDTGWAVGHYGTVLHSRDGGKTWTQQQSETEKTLFSVSFADELHGWASGDESTLISTDNGGESWTYKRIPVSQVGLNDDMRLAVPDIMYYGVHFVDAQHGWMVGEYGNVRNTTDGGQTWGSQHGSLLDSLRRMGVAASDVMSLAAFFRVHFTDQNNGIIVGGAGAVASTADGGQTWNWISREGTHADLPNTPIYDLVQPDSDGDMVLVGSNGLVLNSENNGDNWTPATTEADVFTWLNGVDIAESGKGVMVGGKGSILLTSDFGKTWRPIKDH